MAITQECCWSYWTSCGGNTLQQLHGHLSPITKTIQIRWIRHVGHCWRKKDKLISDVLLQTPAHRRAKAWKPARTYIQKLCANVAWKTSREQWAIETGAKRRSGRFVLAAQHHDDDIYIYNPHTHTYIYIYNI